MKEVKPPRRSMMYYGLIVILTMMIINAFIMPSLERKSIKEVGYETFMQMTEEKKIAFTLQSCNSLLIVSKRSCALFS